MTPHKNDLARIPSLLMAGVLAFALLVYYRPYHGIRHDSILYLGQALLRWMPNEFSSDLFFAFGSQAKFTLFPQLVAVAFDHFLPADFFLGMTLLGLLSFVLASLILVHRLFAPAYCYWALLLLTVLPSGYGGYGVFAYAEAFFTGRSFAEPLVLLALAAIWGRHYFLSACLWLCAALIHPLQALPALILVWSFLVLQDRRWLHALWLPALALTLGWLGISPLSALVAPYDAQWMEWIREPNQHVFLLNWELTTWCHVATDIFLVSLVAFGQGIRLAVLARALLLTLLVGFVASLVLVDGLGLVFPTGLQLWRVQWLVHWFAVASIPFSLVQLSRDAESRSIRLGLFVAIVAMGLPSGGLAPSPLAVLILIPLFVFWPRLRPAVGPKMQRLLAWSIPAVQGLGLIKFTLAVFDVFHRFDEAREQVRPEFMLLSYPLVSGALIFGIWFLHRRYRGRAWWPWLGLGAACVFLLYAADTWDRRSQWTRYIETAQGVGDVFGVPLKPGGQVFWYRELEAPWLILRRPSYFNGHQMSGLLFNRGTAEEGARREDLFKLMEFQIGLCRIMNTLNNSTDSCAIDEELVTQACEGSAGQLSYLVLDNALKVPALGSWRIKGGGIRGDDDVTYYLYQCSDFVPR